jgi:hypothetical protein
LVDPLFASSLEIGPLATHPLPPLLSSSQQLLSSSGDPHCHKIHQSTQSIDSNQKYFDTKICVPISMSDSEEQPSTPVGIDPSGGGASAPATGIPHHLEDPHFEQIVNEMYAKSVEDYSVCYRMISRDIQLHVDMLLFGSVFLRQPQGLAEGTFGILPKTSLHTTTPSSSHS